jgi:hypothetical protein
VLIFAVKLLLFLGRPVLVPTLVPELLKAILCIGLTVFATTTQAGGVTASADIETCDSRVDVNGKAFLRERRSDEVIKLVDVFTRIKGLS